jgi:tripartite-type tricarboxylate transporter receptor subunit TctC
MKLLCTTLLHPETDASSLPTAPCFSWAHGAKQRDRFAKRAGLFVVLTAIAGLNNFSSAAAQSGGFYAGKTVTMIIPGTGGGNDQWGRLVARHIGRHLPGTPTVVPQYMPGAGGLNAVNHIYIAPKDGTVLGLVPSSLPIGPLLGVAGARFDAPKLTWVGSPTMITDVCIAMARAPVKTFHDLLVKELITGNTGVGSGPYMYPKALNGILGTKFKLIAGFRGTSDVHLAMERGEIDGVCHPLEAFVSSRPDWIASKTVNVLFQAGARPNPVLKDVPLIVDLARTPEERQAVEFLYAGNGLGRPFIAPPNMPVERVKMLREAFMATMSDPEFLADAERQKLYVQPDDGEYLAALIKKIYATPKPIVERITELIK